MRAILAWSIALALSVGVCGCKSGGGLPTWTNPFAWAMPSKPDYPEPPSLSDAPAPPRAGFASAGSSGASSLAPPYRAPSNYDTSALEGAGPAGRGAIGTASSPGGSGYMAPQTSRYDVGAYGAPSGSPPPLSASRSSSPRYSPRDYTSADAYGRSGTSGAGGALDTSRVNTPSWGSPPGSSGRSGSVGSGDLGTTPRTWGSPSYDSGGDRSSSDPFASAGRYNSAPPSNSTGSASGLGSGASTDRFSSAPGYERPWSSRNGSAASTDPSSGSSRDTLSRDPLDTRSRDGGYTPGDTGYRPGATGYQPGRESDYQPGRTGYDPPNTPRYEMPASPYTPPGLDMGDSTTGFRPGSVSRYVPRTSTSDAEAATAASGEETGRTALDDPRVSPAGFSTTR